MPLRRCLIICVATALSSACIERPTNIESRLSARIDRASMPDVFVHSVPPQLHPVGAIFGGEIELIGYTATPEPATHGQEATIAVYYRALQDITDDWQIFVHAGDESKGQPRFNVDHYPARGRAHTYAWRRGDIIRDAWSFMYPASIPTLDLWTGFYQGDDRMPLTSVGSGTTDGANRERIGSLAAQ